MRVTWFGLYCGLMLSVSAFSIDILLPAMLDMSSDLQVSVQQIQLLVPAYMVGLGLAHPLFGLLSDRIGRKKAIYIGLCLYLLGTLVVTLSLHINAVLFGRLIQGIGAASAPVVCRAMIRDKFSGTALAQNMAIAAMFFALGPMIAPIMGHLINQIAGWRALFGFLLVFGVFMLWSTARQSETLPQAHRQSFAASKIRADVVAIYAVRQSRYFILVSSICSAAIFTFLTHAPLVYERDLGASEGLFAVMFAVSATGIVLGQWVNHRLIEAVGTVASATAAAMLLTLTAAFIALGSVAGWMSVGWLSLLIFVFNSAYLIVYSNFASQSLDPHPQRAGMAAALYGFTSYIVGSLIAILVAWLTQGELVRWSLAFLVLSAAILCAAGYWWRLVGNVRAASD